MRSQLATFALAFAAMSCATPRPAAPVDAMSSPTDSGGLAVDSAACVEPARRALAELRVELYVWDGEPAPSLSVPWSLPASCGPLVSSASWLTAVPSADSLQIVADPATLPTGLHTAELSLRASGGEVLATATARLRVLRAPRPPATRRALVVGYDGARPDALERARTPVLDFLRRRAAQSFAATTHRAGPTVSAPGWMSAFTGVDPSRHRVVANGEYGSRDGRYRTFVARLSDAGRRAVVSTAWEEVITQIVEPNDAVPRHYGLDPFAARWLATQLRTTESDAYFQHLNDPDAAGHSSGFSADNPVYIRALEACDGNLGVLLDAVLSRPAAASEDWLFVLTTDHGGRGTSHGAIDDDNQRIYFVASGASVRPEVIADGVASHMDTAPTVLQWLGVTIDPAWGLQGVPRGR